MFNDDKRKSFQSCRSVPPPGNPYNLLAGPLPSTSHAEVAQSFCSSLHPLPTGFKPSAPRPREINRLPGVSVRKSRRGRN
jgi:hypothetical protein